MGKINMIRKEGGSRVVSISSAIPESWRAVEIEVVKKVDSSVIIKFKKVK